MTTTDGQASRLALTAILAQLILLRHNKRLPEPTDFTTYTSGSILVELNTLADCHVWLRALGGKRDSLTLTEFEHRPQNRHSYSIGRWSDTGWRIQVYADVDRPVRAATDFDAETVAGLEAVAAGQPAAPAETVDRTRIDEIVDILNGHRAWEFEPGTDLVNGRTVRVSTTPSLLDANVDNALEWAREQIDVAETVGRDADESGTASVILTDGTVINWIPGESQWSVTIADAAPKTLIHIVGQDPALGVTSVRIPDRDDNYERIGLAHGCGGAFPAWLGELPVGSLVYANVNAGAESAEDLVFTNWTKS